MNDIKIYTYPDPILRQVSVDYNWDNEEYLNKTINALRKHIYPIACGLSAIQLGIPLRVIMYGIEPEEPKLLINPVIINKSENMVKEREGCVSFPELYFDVERHEEIEVEYYTKDKKKIVEKFTDFNSIVIQHEIDHMNGVLFFDHLSKQKQKFYLKRYKKLIERVS